MYFFWHFKRSRWEQKWKKSNLTKSSFLMGPLLVYKASLPVTTWTIALAHWRGCNAAGSCNRNINLWVWHIIIHSKSMSPTDPATDKQKQHSLSSRCIEVMLVSMDLYTHTPGMPQLSLRMSGVRELCTYIHSDPGNKVGSRVCGREI